MAIMPKGGSLSQAMLRTLWGRKKEMLRLAR